jgi:protein-arginine kinase activator protein McsA
METEDSFKSESKGSEITKMSTEELEQKLNEALQIEDYQRAAMLRDELNKRK